jgi:hypothetical protein
MGVAEKMSPPGLASLRGSHRRYLRRALNTFRKPRFVLFVDYNDTYGRYFRKQGLD